MEGVTPPQTPHTCRFGFACNVAQCNYHVFHTRNICKGKAKFVLALIMEHALQMWDSGGKAPFILKLNTR